MKAMLNYPSENEHFNAWFESNNPPAVCSQLRLEAAAPVLLAALQALVDYRESDYEEIPEVKQARAAIKRARGEQ